jgi:hypothetical protein
VDAFGQVALGHSGTVTFRDGHRPGRGAAGRLRLHRRRPGHAHLPRRLHPGHARRPDSHRQRPGRWLQRQPDSDGQRQSPLGGPATGPAAGNLFAGRRVAVYTPGS